jgi:ribonucleotide reductase beta subunit family protein with ferritin-like domain
MNKLIEEQREEDLKDWIETCLDADAHGSWHRAPTFTIIQDVAELLAPRIRKMVIHSLTKFIDTEIEWLKGVMKEDLTSWDDPIGHEINYNNGYNQCLQDQISHLENIKQELV